MKDFRSKRFPNHLHPTILIPRAYLHPIVQLKGRYATINFNILLINQLDGEAYEKNTAIIGNIVTAYFS